MSVFTGPIKEIVHGIYDGPHATPPEAEAGPIFLGITNVTEAGRLDLSQIRYVSEEHYPKWTRNENDETRKRFEVMCREVFKKFKACINVEGVNDHRGNLGAIKIVYMSLQRDREQADISDIIRQLQEVVDEAIEMG